MDGPKTGLPAIVILTAALLGGCENLPGTKTQQGAVAGGAAGAVLGHEVSDSALGTLIGAVAGGALGAALGERMTDEGRDRVAEALEQNRTLTWSNDQTGARSTVTPTETFYSEGRTCREYVIVERLGGDTNRSEGSACRQADGSWNSQV